MGAREAVENAAHFLFGEDGGQAFGLLGVQGVNRAQVLFQHLAVEEQKGAEGLILGGGGDILFDRQMGEERFDFGRPHLVRVAFAMEQDKAPDPVHVGVFGADGVVFKAQGIADLVEKFLGSWFHWCSSVPPAGLTHFGFRPILLVSQVPRALRKRVRMRILYGKIP